MRFERVLQIYWTKGFLYGGRLLPFQTSLPALGREVGGFAYSTQLKFIRRFELHEFSTNRLRLLNAADPDLLWAVNVLLSQLTSINSPVSEVVRAALIRLYLIKSYRGRAQALGKPARGQRTWSNAWGAFRANTTIRNFIGTVQREMKNQEPEKKSLNRRFLEKKTRKKADTPVKKEKVVKKSAWY